MGTAETREPWVFLKGSGAICSGSVTVGNGAVIAMKDGAPKLRKRAYIEICRVQDSLRRALVQAVMTGG
jgi:hypothetical protein